MALKWFDASEAEKFGKVLAQNFLKKIPDPKLGKQKKSVDLQADVVDKLYSLIEQFKLNNKLNIYKKAKLANSFRNELIAGGHQEKFVDTVTTFIVKKL